MLFSAALRKKVQERNESRDVLRTDETGRNTAPGRRRPLVAPVTRGLLPQTQIATARGWMPASRLRTGDMVLTFDHGALPLVDVVSFETDVAASPMEERAVAVPVGALENRSPLVLLPGQGVLIDCDQAEEMFGDPFALVPAAALVGLRGIAEVDMPQDAGLCPRFAQDQLIYANGAALWLCPGVARPGPGAPSLAPLPIDAARDLIERLIAEEDYAPETDAPTG